MNPGTDAERLLTKLPVQFRDMLHAGEQLSENLGAKFAEWAKGSPATKPPASQPTTPTADDLLPYEHTGDERAAEGVTALQTWWASIPSAFKTALKTRLDTVWKPAAAKVAS